MRVEPWSAVADLMAILQALERKRIAVRILNLGYRQLPNNDMLNLNDSTGTYLLM
jgi:hypothetical protein